MSFNHPKQEKPYSKTVKWKGSDGGFFSIYDAETKENLDFPLTEFIVLEEMNSISGYNPEKQTGVWSNEVLDLSTEVLDVRIGDRVDISGLYKDIKNQIKGIGGKFTVVLFALWEGEIIRILLSGSGCSGWIEKRFSPMARQCGVRLIDKRYGKTGATEFHSPVFEPMELTDDEKHEAVEQCKILEGWMKNRKTVKVDPEINQEETVEDEHNQDEPANAKHEAYDTDNPDQIPF